MKIEHEQVLRTMYRRGLITRQAMKSIRGQVIRMQTNEEREAYLRKIINRIGREKRNDRALQAKTAYRRV